MEELNMEPSTTTNITSSSSTNDIKTKTSSVTVANIDYPSHPLYQHRRIVSDFEYGDILGEGSYSTVILGTDKKTNKQYAIKKLDKAHIVKNDKVKYVMIERDALSKMNHPGIVKLYWTFRDNRSLYYVLDLAPNGELYTFIRKMAPFDIETARFYASELLLAMEHIQNKNVIHRDIKPENILLDENMHIKITDFGSAKILSSGTDVSENGSTRSFVGTAEYVSPELLRSEPTSKGADWWAFGCVLFQMISGRSPFKAATDYLIFQNIKNLAFEFPTDFPEVAKDLVEKLLVLDPEKRFGSDKMGGIDAVKNHPFFEGIIWENVFGNHHNLPELIKKYMEELKYQQLQQKLLKEQKQNNNEDEDDFETWFNGNDHDDQQQSHMDTTSSSRYRRYQRYQLQQMQQQQQLQLAEEYQQLEHPLYDPQQGQLVSPIIVSNNVVDGNPFSDHNRSHPPSHDFSHPLSPSFPIINNNNNNDNNNNVNNNYINSNNINNNNNINNTNNNNNNNINNNNSNNSNSNNNNNNSNSNNSNYSNDNNNNNHSFSPTVSPSVSSTAVNLPQASTSAPIGSKENHNNNGININNNISHSPSLPHQFLPSNSTKSSFSTTDNSTIERLGNQSHPPW
ncbi:unnamed protein product [Cunninghamella blakesleeana]